MKLTILFLISAVLIEQVFSNGWAPAHSEPEPAPAPAPAPAGPPVVAPALPPSLLPSPVPLPLNPFVGLGPLGLGPAGLGLGFGGLGLGLGLGGLGLLGPLGLRGFGFNPLWRNPFGRRSVEETPVSNQNRTTCSYARNESLIRCVGGIETIECPVEARLEEIRNITLRLPVLNMIPEIIKTKEAKEADILRLVSRTNGSRFTLIHPKTNGEVLLSIYSSPAIAEPGFLVKDVKCMDRIGSLVSPSGVEGARFSLIIRA